MSRFLLMPLFLAVMALQTSCGMLMHQANTAKHILQWPFRAEVEQRLLDGVPDLEREHRLSQWG